MVQALPNLGQPHEYSAIDQAASYYSNLLAQHLVNQAPQTKRIFEQWKQESQDAVSPRSSTLSSELEKNEDLKDLILAETPWVVAADKENEQRQRLADFFDANTITNRLQTAVDKLAALQNADGSFSWYPGMEGSTYITVAVEEMLARLQSLGCEWPTEAPSALYDKAFNFMAKEMVEQVSKMKKEEKKGYRQTFPSFTALRWLYLCAIDDLPRLYEAGVRSLKIEGRLKDADYVTNITAYYREKLDRFADGVQTASLTEYRPICTRTFVPNPEKTFHRGGIDYFLHGRTPHMANWDTPKSTGEYIGEVLETRGNTLRVRLKEGVVLHNGDGLSIGNEGFNVNGVEGNIVKVNKEPTSISSLKGRGLYRNLDVEFVKSLKSERKIPVDVIFSETEDGFRICIGENERTFVYAKEPAKNEQKAMETIRTQLSKLGDTPYIARGVRIESKPYFIPISVLNEWRRATIL